MKHIVKSILILSLIVSCKPSDSYHANITKMWKSDIQINPSSLVIHNESIYCHSESSILKLNLSDGSKIWEHENQGSYLKSKPVVIGEESYFAGRNILQKVNSRGKIVWKISTGQKTFGLTHYQNLIINCRTNLGLFANDVITGNEIWSIKPTYQLLSPTSPTLSENQLFIGNLGYNQDKEGAVLTCFNLKNQSQIWSYKDKFCDTYGQPTTDSMFVYFNVVTPYQDGYTVKLNKKTGKLIWRVRSEPEVSIAPILKDNIIYLSSYKEGIKALDTECGEVLFTGNNKENQSLTELMNYKNSIIYGNQKRELVSLKKNGEIDIISKFEYGIGNPIENEKTLYVMDGNSTLSKIRSY